MVSVTVLLVTAASFWGSAAPGVAQTTCPDGVRYNVTPRSQMINHNEKGVQAEARLGSCKITFRAGWRQFSTDREACRTVLHEYGHAALSLDHDAGGIMAPSSTRDATTPGVCMRFSRSQKTLAAPSPVYWS